jgi:hypothetical protein
MPTLVSAINNLLHNRLEVAIKKKKEKAVE